MQVAVRCHVGVDHALQHLNEGGRRCAGPAPLAQGQAHVAQGQARNAERLEPGWRVGERSGGEQGRPVAAQGDGQEQAQPVDLGFGGQGGAGVAGGQVELLAEGRVRGGQGELDSLQVPNVQLARPGQRMVLGRQQHDVLVEKRTGPQLGMSHGQVYDSAVDRPVGQQHAEGGRRRFGGDEPHIGVLSRQPVQQQGH